jgi:hypothetical protein
MPEPGVIIMKRILVVDDDPLVSCCSERCGRTSKSKPNSILRFPSPTPMLRNLNPPF